MVCFKTKPNETITVEQIEKIFGSSEDISETRACAAFAGEVGLFDIDVIGNDWRCDDYFYVSMHGATILGWPTQAKLQIVLE